MQLPCSKAVAGIGGRRRQHAIVGHVVVDADEFRSSAGHDGHQAGERIRRLGGRGALVVHAGFACSAARLGQVLAATQF